MCVARDRKQNCRLFDQPAGLVLQYILWKESFLIVIHVDTILIDVPVYTPSDLKNTFTLVST